MIAHNNNTTIEAKLELVNNISKEDCYDNIPLDISDIILICKEYNKLGLQIQSQVEIILELGVKESIDSGMVNNNNLIFIKSFLEQITKNPYFGDSVLQAKECIELISQYEENSMRTDPLKLN
jgi:hypothetical protein